MKLKNAALLAAAGGAVMLAASAAAEPKTVYFDGRGNAQSNKIDNQWICVFNKGAVSKGNVRSRANQAAGPHGGRVLKDFKHSIRGFSVRMAPQALENMKRRNPNIAYCEQDEIVTLAPPPGKGKPPKDGGDGGGGSGPTEVTPPGIDRVNAGQTYTGNNVAWVIDSGIDLNHPDLNVDVGRSRDFVTRKRNNPDDGSGHGTHVAGTIAAIDNDIGVVGVAAGATVISVRVLDRRGSGSYSGVIEGVDYVAGAGASGDVANMSLGGPVSQALDDAVIAAASGGIKFVLAAGNSGEDTAAHSPARANGPNVFTIAALNSNYTGLAGFSNYSQGTVEYAEPGSGIFSTYKDGGYATLSGTSMAAPHAAGLLLWGNISNGGNVSGPDGSYTVGVR